MERPVTSAGTFLVLMLVSNSSAWSNAATEARLEAELAEVRQQIAELRMEERRLVRKLETLQRQRREGFNRKEDAHAADFLGKWVGKWDDRWRVQFTVSRDRRGISVVYEWKEHVGQPLRRQTGTAEIEDDLLKLGDSITLSISADDTNHGRADGQFRTPRTAWLTRERARR